MSIMQDYENIRKDLGFKYDAIEDYLNVVSPPSQYKKYEEELKKLSSLDYENFDIKNKIINFVVEIKQRTYEI